MNAGGDNTVIVTPKVRSALNLHLQYEFVPWEEFPSDHLAIVQDTVTTWYSPKNGVNVWRILQPDGTIVERTFCSWIEGEDNKKNFVDPTCTETRHETHVSFYVGELRRKMGLQLVDNTMTQQGVISIEVHTDCSAGPCRGGFGMMFY